VWWGGGALPHVGVTRKPHALRHYADDCRGNAVDVDRPAKHSGVGAVARLPESVADDDDRLGAFFVLRWEKVAPEVHGLTQHAESVGAHFGGRCTFRWMPAIRHVE